VPPAGSNQMAQVFLASIKMAVEWCSSCSVPQTLTVRYSHMYCQFLPWLHIG